MTSATSKRPGVDPGLDVADRTRAERLLKQLVGGVEADDEGAEARVLDHEPDEVAMGEGDDRRRVLEVGGELVDDGAVLLGDLAEERGDDLVLAREVVVEGAGGDVGAVGDLAEPGGADPLLREELTCGSQQPGPGFCPAPVPAVRLDLSGGHPRRS